MNTPKSITIGKNLNFISIGLGMINFILEGNFSLFAVIVGAITWFLLGFFTIMASKKENWARVTSLIIFLIGIIPFLLIIPNFIVTKPLPIIIITFTITLFQVLALYFFFNKESNAWFKSKAD